MSEKKHILVVEDEKHLAVGIRFNLEAEGYRATTVGDGISALQLLREETSEINMVVLDLMLPGMSGYEVCQAMRETGIDIPILILSARTLTEDRTRGFDVGADQYLAKPFELDELISRVNNLLILYDRRAKGRVIHDSGRKQFHFGRAEIDFEHFQAKVGGQEVRLTQLLWKLLEYFVRHEGRVIPRNELLEKVWDMPGSIETRAVDQFMRRLRKIFEVDPSQPRHFLTIRDMGYRFVSEADVDGSA
ncbi:MAG: response regulator transcription factor [Pirellulaceae bacterium]|jgi:two-component system OmpR family response regulator|nr:response regulator transcription factor [Pirellulaceae bacterium]MDP6555337.1 response regulator transcription factor [Pirellulaceae bacterium]